MATDVTVTLLGEIADEITVGHVGPMVDEYVEVGVPFLRSQNVEPLRINLDDVKFVSDEFHRRLKKSALRPGDVVVVRTGKPGTCAVIPPTLPSANCSDLVIVRCGPDLDPRFLAYYINSAGTHHVEAHLVGAVQQHFNVGSARRIALHVPPLAQQRAIVDILGTLDDKIELNRRMNETLEAMARALFEHWLESARAGRASVSDLTRQGVLEIGDGYRAKNSELGEPGLPFIRAGDLDAGFDTHGAEVLHQTSVAKAGNKLSRPGDVAFTSKGTVGRVARVTERTSPFVYSPQVCFWRSLDPKRLRSSLLYCWMTSHDFRAQVQAVAGQTDMALYVSLRDQRAMEFPAFGPDQHTLADQLDAVLARQALAADESRTLAALRDTLLPKLISGELRVPEKLVGEAL